MTGGVVARPHVAERLAKLIQQPTVSAERETRGDAPFEALIALLPELYPLVHRELSLERVGPSGLLYRWAGVSAQHPLVLMAHYDVVPVDLTDDWTHPPFAGVVEDGWVYGRGALDDKGPLVVVLEAVENLVAAGFTPARDVYLSFGGDEEVFGASAEAAAALLAERGIEPWLVVDEGGAVVDAPLPFVRGQAAMIGVGEKGILTLRLTARADGGHASAPPPLTAVGRVARAVHRLTPGTFRPRVPRAISRMLRLLADRTPGPARLLYRALAAAPPVTARVLAAMGGEPAAMVRTTVAATMQSGGTADNVLPSQASATINLRIALGETVESTVRRVRRRIADPEVAVEIVSGDEPSPETSVDGPQFALLAEALGVSHPEAAAVPYVMMAATDSRAFHRRFPAVFRFAPLEMSAAQRAAIHGVDERVEIAALERGERFHRELIQRLQ
ncbi:M20/M25/M40 family metallo-hydrolase [Microbacterium fluvii]|uniref:M20/M25/M40 family metallo-hydrolase n=1 Tax=Microbacterium fluvii TaxID=415215 RepID=A0ABW2HB54_9MICO|nr:M20/M25/M40 family metallo-hydrolase [Microbacterium fluvii]MCU4672180.1 M20/M25/M40 family metallo-hydrolase [Microbacterium fluvii]